MNMLRSSDLPPALRIYFDNAPEAFRIPAVLTAATCLCALGTRIRVRYVYLGQYCFKRTFGFVQPLYVGQNRR